MDHIDPNAEMSKAAAQLAATLRRMGPDGLARLGAEQKQDVGEMLTVAAKVRKQSMFWDTFPDTGIYAREYYPKQIEFMGAGLDYRVRCLMGGNRIGKTHVGAFEMTCHLTGMYPHWWEGRRFHEPIDAWAAGKTNATVKDIVQEKLFGGVRKNSNNQNEITGTGMIPGTMIDHDTAVYRPGYPRLIESVSIRYRDSLSEVSTIGLKAYEQGRGAFEGTARHVAWCDEEPPLEIWNEMLIRTGTVNGIIYLTFTPLDGITETVEQFLTDEYRPLMMPTDDEYTEF